VSVPACSTTALTPGQILGREFEPVPLQRPDSGVGGGRMAEPTPVRRALHWDGLFPIGLPGPEALAELAAEISAARPDGGQFDLNHGASPDADLEPWRQAGLTWAVTFLGCSPPRQGSEL